MSGAAILMSIALTLASLAPAKRAAFIESLTLEEALVLKHDWSVWARPGQLPPASDEWATWLVLAGRGYGKTRVGGEQVHAWAKDLGLDGRIALVGKDPGDVRKTMIEGEALALDTAIPTPSGWTTMGALRVGDELFARDGSVTRVIAASEAWPDRPCYAVLADAAPIIADARHQWVTSSRTQREPRRSTRRESIRTTAELAETLTTVGRPDLYEHEILTAHALVLPNIPLPIPPYTLGAWLGDGDTRGHGTFTCHETDAEIVDQIRREGYVVRRLGGRYDWGIHGLRVALRAAQLNGRKHVPAAYLRAGTAQRLALLQGLMDTDGDVSARGQCAFNNTNRRLVLAARELMLTMGLKPGVVREHTDRRGHQTIHRVTFTVGPGQPIPFRLARKAARCRPAVRSRGRLVRAVTPVAAQSTRCIQVAHRSGTFLAGEDFVVTHNSGLIPCAAPWFAPTYEPALGILTWPNGCRGFTYSSEVPDKLRGPQHHKFWGDELCKWKHAQDTWDNLQFGLRLGDNPQGVITTTPRPIATLKEILNDPATVITRGSTFDNKHNLPKRFLDRLLRLYAGTRLGRQELNAELLTDTPGALWTLKMIETCRVRTAPHLVRLGIAIDPAASSPSKDTTENDGHAETGMVAGGIAADGMPYVLQDVSAQRSPGEWGKKAVELYNELKADFIVAEANNGGEMVAHVVRTAARDLKCSVNIRIVHASRGKQTRAEPVAALYEQRRARHVGTFPELEDQMSTWVPGQKSPDRMDALVWLITALAIDGAPDMPDGLMDIGADARTDLSDRVL